MTASPEPAALLSTWTLKQLRARQTAIHDELTNCDRRQRDELHNELDLVLVEISRRFSR
jgi:hypothetical protein